MREEMYRYPAVIALSLLLLVSTYINKRTYISGELILHNVSSIQREPPLRYGQ